MVELPRSPESLRRMLRHALRDARDEAGLTQRHAAETLEWSVSKIIRIEQGVVGVTTSDLKWLLDLYKVKDEKRREHLLDLARRSRRRPSWSEFSNAFSADSLILFGSESDARTILKYEPTFVPGILQTEEHTRALLKGLGIEDQKRVNQVVAARAQRQELLQETQRPELRFVIGEAAVSRNVGGRAIMRNQLERIHAVSRLPGVNIQILDFDAGAHPKMGGAFTVLEFSDVHLEDLLYLENASGDKTIRDVPEMVADFREAFEILSDMATPSNALETRLDEIASARFGIKTPN
jgi:transcriptional regulator with XRE-family HTH domain